MLFRDEIPENGREKIFREYQKTRRVPLMQLQVELQKRKEIMYLEANKQKKEKKKKRTA